MDNEELGLRVELAFELIADLRKELEDLKSSRAPQKFTKHFKPKRTPVYEPNDGSKSEWAKTPEGKAWWNKPPSENPF